MIPGVRPQTIYLINRSARARLKIEDVPQTGHMEVVGHDNGQPGVIAGAGPFRIAEHELPGLVARLEAEGWERTTWWQWFREGWIIWWYLVVLRGRV